MLPSPPTSPLKSGEDMSPDQRAIFEKVREKFETMNRFHKPHRDRWAKYYGLYRNYRNLKSAHAGASSQRDRDDVLNDAQREFGAELFVPYVFATVETILPRALSNDPKMLVLPADEDARDAAEPVRKLFERQQNQADVEMKLQPTARRGFLYGLGVQKTYWHKETRSVQVTGKRTLLPGYKTEKKDYTLFDGPMIEDVDTEDFFWDPSAKSIATCECVIHRTWRSMKYVKKMVESGVWYPLDLEKVQAWGSDTERGDMWKDKWQAAGLSDLETNTGRMHEVLEYHDGEYVYTVLDKTVLVQANIAPASHGEIPFQIFRPTMVPGEFVGIGEVEPIAHLQYELNTLRSQRRDNATMVLQQAIAYAEGMVDPDDLVIGPGAAIPTLGDPSQAIMPIRVGEIPASGYREEEALKSDIERTTGVSDPITGAEASTSSSNTATGIQLIQAAANFRIRQKSKNLERETIKPACQQWLWLNRQHVLEEKTVRIEDPNAPEGYAFAKVTPDDLHANLDVLPAGGSTEPENLPQKRNDAMTLFNQLGQNPGVNQQKLMEHLLKQFDVRDAEAWILPPPPPPIDIPTLGHALAQQGIPEPMVKIALDQGLAAAQAASPQTQPQPQQEQPPAEGPAQNGNTPEPVHQH